MLSWNWRYSGWHRSGRWVTGKMSGQWLSTVVSHLHNKLRDVSPHLHGYYSPPSSWIRTTIFFFSPYVDFCIFKGSSPSIFSAVLLLDLHHPEFHHAYIVTIIRAPSHLSISAQVAVLCSSILLHYTALLFFFNFMWSAQWDRAEHAGPPRRQRNTGLNMTHRELFFSVCHCIYLHLSTRKNTGGCTLTW